MRRSRLALPLAAMLLAVTCACPVAAAGEGEPAPLPATTGSPDESEDAHATATSPTVDAKPVDDMGPARDSSTVDSGPPRRVASDRDTIAADLVQLGWSAEEARLAAAQLTPADLAVLVDHPAMMQNAGASSSHTAGIIVGVLLLGGLIALAWAGDGFITGSF